MPMTKEEAERYGHGSRSQAFADWRNALDAELVKLTSMTADELVGDWYYADHFDYGVSPKRAARALLRYARNEY